MICFIVGPIVLGVFLLGSHGRAMKRWREEEMRAEERLDGAGVTS